jgi:hypothetical protein
MLICAISTLISPRGSFALSGLDRPAGQWQRIGASFRFVHQERSPFFGGATLGAQQCCRIEQYTQTEKLQQIGQI